VKTPPVRRSLALAGLVLVAASAAKAATCPTVDLETPLEQLAREVSSLPETDQVAAYRSRILAPHAGAFRPEVLGEFGPEVFPKRLLASLQAARSDPARPVALRDVRKALASAEDRFRIAFPDFRCDFPIYLMDSLGRLDGAGRQVDGRPALVLGIDQIEQERDVLPLPVFLSHELFHRYHSQVSGFSDDPGEHQAIWRALWAEGLATYVSYRLTPGATVDAALIAPRDLTTRAQPRVGTIAADLLAHLDQVDHDVYQTYFTYGDPRVTARGLPWRSGYYLGFLVAQDLGRTRSLRELAAMRGPQLEAEIGRALARLAGAPA
jgi:hypothetical protein